MKKLLIALAVVGLVGCAKEGPMGPAGASAPSFPNFQGFYILPDAGYLEIIQDTGSLSDLNQVRVTVRNTDASTGLLPMAAVNNLPIQNGVLYYLSNLTYAASNNIKTDAGNTVLVGSFFTSVTMSRSGGVLSVRTQISNGASVVFDHTVTSL